MPYKKPSSIYSNFSSFPSNGAKYIALKEIIEKRQLNSGTQISGIPSIWFVHWDGTQTISATGGSGEAVFSSPDWAYSAVVPAVRFRYSNRTPGDTGTNEMTAAQFEVFVDRISQIPSGYRAVNTRYWYHEFVGGSSVLNEYYKATADGTTYEGERFVTPWADQNLIDAKHSMRAFLDRCLEVGLTFDYLFDDKENQDRWHIGGIHSSNYWGSYGADGLPVDPGVYSEPIYQVRPDARAIPAIFNDARFNTQVSPFSGLTLGAEVIRNYRELSGDTAFAGSVSDLFGSLVTNTGPTAFAPTSSLWTPYPATDELGYDRIANGYTLFHYAVPAWNAATDSLHFNDYAHKMFLDVLAEYPEFSHVKVLQYDIAPVGIGESFFLQLSNLDREYRYPQPDVMGGMPMYGSRENVISNYNLEFADIGTANFDLGWANRSGYVRSLGNSITDEEKYNFMGYLVDEFYGVTANGGTYGSPERYLVRYPNTKAVDAATTETYKDEIAYKYFVQHNKKIRAALRSDLTFYQRFAPWVTDPDYGYFFGANPEKAYWYELLFHTAVDGARLFQFWSSTNRTDTLQDMQNFSNEWESISGSSRTIPCANSTGDIALPVDRILLEDAFDKVLMSGGKLEKTGEFLWRITVPPKFVDGDGKITLNRVGSDVDVPASITIEGANAWSSRGCWIKRSISTPPNYIPIEP